MDSKLSPIESLCSVCKIQCQTSCGLCKKVSYCSKEHQRLDWKQHKINCFPAIIKTNLEFGRHFVTTKAITQGELIFKEKPLVSGPSGKDGVFPVCLACYRIVRTEYTCSKCKWPLCNTSCENNTIHSENECRIFSTHDVPPFSPEDLYMYEKIIVLRGILLKETSLNVWNKVLDLESHAEARLKTKKGKLLSESAVQFIRETCKQEQINAKEIDHVVGVLGTNAFSSEDSISCGQFFRSGCYLYYNASLPAHACCANSKWVIQMNSEFQLRASVNIPSGSVITQLYTQPFAGTSERRKHLEETKYFACHCERCSDATELNTFFSGIRCSSPSCQMGFLLQKNPLQSDSLWECNNNQCKISKSSSEIEGLTYRIASEIDELPEDNTLEAVNALESLLEKYRGRILHENHYLIYQLENDIMQRVSFILTLNSGSHKLSKEQCNILAEKLIELTRKNLTIVGVLAKGITRHKGRLLYFLQQGLQIKILNGMNLKSFKGKRKEKLQPNPELKSQIDEFISVRKEAGIIFEDEPESREESILLKFLRDYSKEIQSILKFYGQISVSQS